MERQSPAKVQKSGPRANHLQAQSARSPAPAHPLLALQRSIGNQAVRRLIRSPYIQTKLKVSTPGDQFEQEADHVADTVMRMPEAGAAGTETAPIQVQAKPIASQITPLVQRQSKEPLEEEKEKTVAAAPILQRVPLAVREDDDEEKVAPKLDANLSPQEEKKEETLQAAPMIQRLCTECEGEKERGDRQPEEMVHRKAMPEQLPEDDEVEQVQAKAAPTSTPKVTTSVAASIAALNGGGSPLPDTTRAFFEPRFSADLSQVRIHTGTRVEETAKSINARAFTVGRDIAFGAAQYAPESAEGKRLLAHELVHTIQQQSSTPSFARQSNLTGDLSNNPCGSPEQGTATKVESKGGGSGFVQRQPTDPQQGANPPGQSDPNSGGLGAMALNFWLSLLPAGALSPTNVIVQGPDKAPVTIPAGAHGTQGFWEDLIDALKPRPCKFYLCETMKVCKPPDPDPDPDKGDDIWKWWKWKCRDTKVCWCGLHEVPANTADAVLLTLATAPDSTRAVISKKPLVQEFLRIMIGDKAWPLALRILAKSPSAAIPSLDEATWYLADHAIKSGAFPEALGIILDALVSRGIINASLANWSHVARQDRGEGLTSFKFVEDPVSHERRATAPVRVEIYDPGFADVGWLFSTMMHEYVHVLQVIAGGYSANQFDDKGKQRPEFVAKDEVESYLWEIEHALGSGVVNNPAQMKEIGQRLTQEFEAMTPELKAQYKPRYDAAQRRVLDVLSQRPGMSIDDARRIVQETSQEIAELLKQRPGNEAAIDAKIATVRARRSEAMIQVALVDNPNIQVVKPGEPGTYRVPTVDGEGRVRYLHGGIQVAWHMAEASTSAYTIGEAIGAGGKMAVSGTAIQGRVHPFPPDIDFDEHIHVVAGTLEEAGRAAAKPIIDSIRKISGGPTPGRTDIEFRHLITFPKKPGKTLRMSLSQAREGDAVAKLGHAIAQLNGGNLSTFWRGILADGRLTEVTRVVFVTANKPDGTPLMALGGSADFNLAFLEDPGEQPATPLGQFAWAMCCEAVRRAEKKEWLKAAKRAYNYFSTIGDLTHMAQLEPMFRGAETNVEQYAVVIDAIKQALVTKDRLGPKQEGTRILTVEQAQKQMETVAGVVETLLPNSGASPSPAEIAKTLRDLAGEFHPRDAARNLKLDDILADKFDHQATAIRVHINAGVRDQVQPIVEKIIRPVCPDEDKCKKG
jgi:hypothetical protein